MRDLIKKILLEVVDDLEWIDSIEPSWVMVGQKFTSKHNLNLNNEDGVQVGASTFEIYDITEHGGDKYLRFAHSNVLENYYNGIGSWDMEAEKGKSYKGLRYSKAKENVDGGFWIPLVDCEFKPSEHPNLVGKTDQRGKPYGFTYCKPVR